jgi:hypothetical protein
MTNYSREEIVRSYLHSQNKTEQIFILAELTLSDTDTIIEVLKDAGVLQIRDIHKRICCRCGREYITPTFKGTPVCNRCQGIQKEIKKQEYALKRMTAQMQDHTRKIGELKVQSEKIRERIQELKNQYEVQV